jgi:hypothetical protein
MSDREVERREAVVAAIAFAGRSSTKKKRRARGWPVDETRAELEGMIKSGGWEEARPKHFVELFMRMHARVYGVEAIEMARGWKVRTAAASMAARLMRDHFGGDPSALATFVRWVWREQDRAEQRRRDGTLAGDFRISWRYQWSPGLVTSYRRALLLEKGRSVHGDRE